MRGKRFGHSCIVILIRIIMLFFGCLIVSLSALARVILFTAQVNGCQPAGLKCPHLEMDKSLLPNRETSFGEACLCSNDYFHKP